MVSWVNGRLVDDPVVSAADRGLTVGDGAFETLRTYRGRPFAVRRHLARLRHSLTGLGLAAVAPDDELLRTALGEVTRAGAGTELRIRLTVTAGPGPAGSARTFVRPTVLCTASELPPWPATAVAACSTWTINERSPVAGLKTTSYAEKVVALAAAQERGADEALLANSRGELCEGTGSNVVVVRGGAVETPSLDSGCLAGVTRALVLRAAAEAGLRIHQRTMPFDALEDADEVLLLSTIRQVQPVVRLDDRELRPGPVGVALAEAFRTVTDGPGDP